MTWKLTDEEPPLNRPEKGKKLKRNHLRGRMPSIRRRMACRATYRCAPLVVRLGRDFELRARDDGKIQARRRIYFHFIALYRAGQ